jgi:rhodanese-related sulfurtransferase
MKIVLFVVSVLALLFLVVSRLQAAEPVSLPDAAKRIEAKTALLIDVREPTEWAEGVAQPALLLSLSDLQGKREQWRQVLKEKPGKELLVYCRSGRRSGIAAEILRKEGFTVTNLGGYSDWVKAGLPTRKP